MIKRINNTILSRVIDECNFSVVPCRSQQIGRTRRLKIPRWKSIRCMAVYATLWNYAVPRISYYCKSIASVARVSDTFRLSIYAHLRKSVVISRSGDFTLRFALFDRVWITEKFSTTFHDTICNLHGHHYIAISIHQLARARVILI